MTRGPMANALLAIFALSCGDAGPAVECAADVDCATGACVRGACVNPARFDCVPGAAEKPGLRTTPTALDFGVASVGTVVREVEIESTGSCTLEIFDGRLEGGLPFQCPCAETFPAKVLPGRKLTLPIELLPGGAGLPSDTLVLTHNVGSEPTRIALRGVAAGTPEPNVLPAELDFGFVPVGEASSLTVQIVNAVDGSAPLVVSAIDIEPPGSAFAATTTETLPASLRPAREDRDAVLPIEVRFRPTTLEAHTATLIATWSGGTIRVPLRGADQPPQLDMGAADFDFGEVRLGRSEARSVSLQNRGPVPLIIDASLVSGSNPDLSLEGDVRSLAPGAVRSLRLVYAPTAPGPITDVLQLRTNDPMARDRTFAITGRSRAESVQVVSIEMRFEGGQDTFLDLDLRDVDVVLESPDGRVCRESTPQANWGPQGLCRWQSNAEENPERLILSDVAADGRYPILVTYVEDCASLPTALTATILGIGTDELLDAVAEEDIMLPPGALEDAIQQACVQRRSAPGTVLVKVNGRTIAERRFALPEKGARSTAVTLVRGPGGFRVQ